MIEQVKDIDVVRPLFERYMWHMKSYGEIQDVPAWIVRANDYFSLYGVDPNKKTIHVEDRR